MMILATVAAALFLALIGSLCIVKPETIQGWFQSQYDKGRILRYTPFSKLIFKPWHPTYLRFMGAWAWILALFFGYAALVTLTRR
jgi:hypothetical protein